MVLRAISSVFQERSFEGIESIAHRVTAYHAPSIFDWQRANEECIDSAEDRGVRANPEGEYGDRDKAEDRRFPKLAERVAKLTHWFLSLGHFPFIQREGLRSGRRCWRGARATSRQRRRRARAPSRGART